MGWHACYGRVGEPLLWHDLAFSSDGLSRQRSNPVPAIPQVSTVQLVFFHKAAVKAAGRALWQFGSIAACASRACKGRQWLPAVMKLRPHAAMTTGDFFTQRASARFSHPGGMCGCGAVKRQVCMELSSLLMPPSCSCSLRRMTGATPLHSCVPS